MPEAQYAMSAAEQPVAAVTRRLVANVDAPRLARAAAAEMVGRCGRLATGRADDLALVVSELVTNAVVHGPDADVELRMTSTTSMIRVEVSDAGTQPFDWPAVDAGGHHGLDLVGKFSDRSGSSHDPTTVAWCELDFVPTG
jgi:anti-sigma regulatory factor (Ser/Thr protein kinase)